MKQVKQKDIESFNVYKKEGGKDNKIEKFTKDKNTVSIKRRDSY